MASLVLLKAGETKSYPLSVDEVVVGRHPECQIQVDSNMVSRKHARVLREGKRFYVEDLGSGNGTTVNGQRIAAKTQLAHDDRIKLGPILFRFEDPNASRPEFPPTPPPVPAQRPVMGVNVDEELVNMLSFEQAFSAAAQFIQVVNQMQEEVLRLV